MAETSAENQDLESLAPCTNEKADTHLFLHALDVVRVVENFVYVQLIQI